MKKEDLNSPQGIAEFALIERQAFSKFKSQMNILRNLTLSAQTTEEAAAVIRRTFQGVTTELDTFEIMERSIQTITEGLEHLMATLAVELHQHRTTTNPTPKEQ
jgi:hypothetical protein